MNASAPTLPRILLLDDEVALHRAVEIQLRGFAELASFQTGEAALAGVRAERFDAALVDINLGAGPSGLDWIVSMHEVDPDLAMIAFTAHGEYGTALESFRVHCFDFIPKSLRPDGEFRSKLGQAVDHTRAQRGRSRNTAEVGVLRTALAEAVVSTELEVSGADIQRGLLAESLDAFSAMLGRIELLNLRLAEVARRVPEVRDAHLLSREAASELHDSVDRLRDYFAEPECAARSINDILAQAVRIVQDDGAERVRFERTELRPDARFTGEGRALLRAVVILLRLMVKPASGPTAVTVRPSLLLDPAADLRAYRARPGARIMHTPDFQKDMRIAVAVELCGPVSGFEPEAILQLFSPQPPIHLGPSPWSAVAMLARAGAWLGVECGPGPILRYRIVVKV